MKLAAFIFVATQEFCYFILAFVIPLLSIFFTRELQDQFNIAPENTIITWFVAFVIYEIVIACWFGIIALLIENNRYLKIIANK